MILLPQAIFTSARRDGAGERAGYQLAARSSGIDDELAAKLSAWGPAHDALEPALADEPSWNFHPLADNLWCASASRYAGAEYSGRSGARGYTQMFLLDRETLSRFANRAYLILEALDASGRLEPFEEPPPVLPETPLLGRSSEPRLDLIEQAQDEYGEALSEIVESLAHGVQVFAAARSPCPRLLAAAIEAIPTEQRLEVSFSTGLRYSARRPFRLQAIGMEETVLRQLERQTGGAVVRVPEAEWA